MAAADLDGDGQRRGRRDDDEHVADRLAGLRLRRRRAGRTSRGGDRDGVAALQHAPGPGNDADFNGVGNHGYGAYGENVGIGNLDDDPQLEIVVTFDNHQINVFNHDGTSVLASPWFTNRQNDHLGARLGWGQFIRWLSPTVEANQYHRHVGPWPDVRKTRWLQWTASPPSVADLDGDGHNEVIGLPNAEMKEPYETQNYAFMVLDGAQNGGARSARRHRGLHNPPLSRKPAVRADDDYYPPSGIPAPTVVDIAGDRRPEIVASVPDGVRLRGGPDRQAPVALRLRPRRGRRPSPRRSSPPTSTATARPSSSSAPTRSTPRSGRLVVLSAAGKRLYDIRLPQPGQRRQRHRRPGRALDRRPRRRRAPGDRALDLRPRPRRLPRPRLGHELPAVADRARQPAAQRHRPGDGLTRYSTTSTSAAWATRSSIAHHLERPRVGRAEHHRRRAARVVGLEPARRADAPAIAGRQPREAPLRARRGQVVAGMRR